jgi:hypothetical protein
MPLLAVTYVKGRPGVTTTALGLAATADRMSRPVLLECDPAGGDLMRRHGLAAEPSMVDLAAAARTAAHPAHPLAPIDVLRTATQLVKLRELAIPVVVAPAGGAQTRAALPELTGVGRSVLAPLDRIVLADCGRLGPGSPAWPLLGLADVVIVVAQARADELAHLREHLGELVDAGAGRVIVLLAAGGTYPPAEVAQVLQQYVAEQLARDPRTVAVLGPLPPDRRAAAVLDGDLEAGRRWRRLPLLAAYAGVWRDLTPLLPTVTRDWSNDDPQGVRP